MKNLEKVFYMLSGIALVFIGIVIGQFLDSDAVAQKLGKPCRRWKNRLWCSSNDNISSPN